ncbi:hypothetical protein C8R44DRAFT_711712 [Mycena epipterygia]|nr:hypothetical protein C8R44DRAFT_711712 [Mycena epipterygia]
MSAIGPALPPHLQTRPPQDDDDEDEGPRPAGPQLPAAAAAPPPEEDDDDEDEYAPALPPDMIASSSKKPVVGPTMPPTHGNPYPYPDSDDDDVGPRPLPSGVRLAERDAVAEFMAKEEKRRREVEEAAKPKAPKRDEWMLVPPKSSVLGNLDPTKLKARQFARSAAPARGADQDSTLWTETPAERQQRLADEVSGVKRRAANSVETEADSAADRKRRRIDEELRRGVEAHTRATRGSALVDMHAKAGKDADGEAEDPRKGVWERDRDMALSGRLMDDDKRNKMLKEAKGLGDRFGTGKTGGFY